MAFVFEDEPTGGQFVFEDEPAPSASTTMEAAIGRQLPPVWDATVFVDGKPAKVRGVYDPSAGEKGAYLVGNRDGTASFIKKEQNGTLSLKPYKAKVSALGSDSQNFAAGIGKGLVDMGRGIKQVGALAGNTLGLVDDATVDATMADVAESRARDAELSDTKAGLAGQVVGAVAGTGSIGLGLRGAGQAGMYGAARLGAASPAAARAGVAAGRAADVAGRALYAPSSYGQAAAAGAALGASQPALNGTERLANTGLGGFGGLAGQAVGVGVAKGLTRAMGGNAAPAAAAASGSAQAREVPVEVVDSVVAPAAQKIGLSFGDLPEQFQKAITAKVDEAVRGATDLTPEQAARSALYEQLGIKPTRALVTRNLDDALNEQNLLTESDGAALRSIYEANNAAFRQRIRDLRPDGAAPVEAPEFGAAFRGDIREGERAAQKAVGEIYKKAAAEEGANLADVSELANFISRNKSRLAASGDQGKFVLAYLDEMDALGENGLAQAIKAGKASAVGAEIPLEQLTDLRAIVNNAWRNASDDNARAVLNQMRQILNKAEWQAGGTVTKQARQARQAKGDLYENNPLVDRLLSRKAGYNADLVEDSQVFESAVLNSSPEQFEAAWRATSSQKTRDLTRAQVADWIEQQVYGGQAMNQIDVIASSAKLAQALKRLGPQKLRLVYGPEKAAELKLLQRALQEVSNPPKGTVPQGSAPKLQFYFRQVMSLLGRTPVAGNLVEGLAKVGEMGAASKAAREGVKRATDFSAPAVSRMPAVRGAAAGGAAIGLSRSDARKQN